jgi:hypothetical protein
VAGTALAGAATIGATVAVASALQAGKTLFMTLTQKCVVVAVVLTAITGAVYEHQVIRRQQEKIASLEQQAATDQRQFRQMLAQRDEARTRAEQAEHLVEAAVAAQANDALTANLRAVKMRVERLKQRISQSPDQQIPEMRFLKEDDWVRAALNQELQTDEDYRKAMSAVRTSAKNYPAQMLQQSLRNYMNTSQGNAPGDVLLLAPYFATPVDYMMLQRYEIEDAPAMSHNVAGIRDKETSIVDDTYDSNVFIGVDGGIGWNSGNNGTKLSFLRAVQEAMAAYRIVNEGKTPKDPAEILPYFKNPTDGQKFMEQSKQSQGLP